ncbi:Lipid-transfer protein [Actinidia chinensis var. chinensis]|uniref:Lipid-transfer protein n=1 Tax=Actinidia chinensis var. chinensis TaxID=1590841 RepID=A0A2R6QKD5_ACTCC|nr:Lipid-transfer protein [Actinidia chinensis var. chinensis]
MEAQMKVIRLVGLLVVVLGLAGLDRADGAGPACGKSSPDDEAIKLAPCAMAAQDQKADVPNNCCVQVKKLAQTPSCLCAVMLSDTAKSSGIKPEIAMTIPKRCNLADRPVGYKCGQLEGHGAGQDT